MKILVLDEEFPWPLNTGKRIRSHNLISRLAVSHDVTYLAYGRRQSEGYVAMGDVGIKPVPVTPHVPPKSGPGFYARLLANLFSRYPYSVDSHYSSDFQEAVDTTIRDREFDLVLCEWTPYARFVENTQGITRMVAAHNVEGQIWERYRANERHAARRWYITRQVVKWRRFERQVFNTVEGATAVSEPDANTLKNFNSDLPVEVIDNGVDLGYFTPGAFPQEEKPRLVFTGSMDWRPNQDAVEYFVHDIFPLLRQQHPDLAISFVGRNPTAALKALEKIDGVEVTGTVDDVRPYIRRAAVYVVPLRIGGGSRLKVLEALAMKKPVVSTSVGAEGLEIKDGREYLKADTPLQFLTQIDRIIRDPALTTSLGEAGRSLVERRYGWDYLAGQLENFISRLVKNP